MHEGANTDGSSNKQGVGWGVTENAASGVEVT